jgi:hypothetical protein
VKLGTLKQAKFINLGTCCLEDKNHTFIEFFKRYTNVPSWSYEELKTYDTHIIQHIIPIKYSVKYFLQKLIKVHPTLELLIQMELNKLLDSRIIFQVIHSMWVSNMVPITKKYREIILCVDFINLNQASDKDNYPIPAMEQKIQLVSGSQMFPLLDICFGYN